MNIVILGAGTIGSYLAEVLSKEEHSVTIVDKDTKILEKIGREIDVATLYGTGAKWKLLDDLIENEPSVFIAVTGDDETNLIACSIAKNLGYPRTVARVKEISFLIRSRLDFSRLFFVDHFICPEILSANEILNNIIVAGDLSIENFAHGTIQMRTITIPSSWHDQNKALKDLELPEELIVGLIRRKNKEGNDEIIFPHGDDHIFPNDEVTLIGEIKMMFNLYNIFNLPEKPSSSIVIIGGNVVAVQLALILDKFHIHTKIIEIDEKRCETLADLLSNATIINHDATQLSFLRSEQIENADAIVSCTKRDSTNLLISLLAKKLGCKKIVSLISDISLVPVLRDLDIHLAVSERVNIANKILSIIHEGNITAISSLCDNQAKIVELKVSPNSKLVGLPLADLSAQLPKKLLVAAIENRGKVMIGKGNRTILPNDTIILITSPEHLHELQDLF